MGRVRSRRQGCQPREAGAERSDAVDPGEHTPMLSG